MRVKYFGYIIYILKSKEFNAWQMFFRGKKRVVFFTAVLSASKRGYQNMLFPISTSKW